VNGVGVFLFVVITAAVFIVFFLPILALLLSALFGVV
jgi:hypothetical protein